jgi:hypothetical protein
MTCLIQPPETEDVDPVLLLVQPVPRAGGLLAHGRLPEVIEQVILKEAHRVDPHPVVLTALVAEEVDALVHVVPVLDLPRLDPRLVGLQNRVTMIGRRVDDQDLPAGLSDQPRLADARIPEHAHLDVSGVLGARLDLRVLTHFFSGQILSAVSPMTFT